MIRYFENVIQRKLLTREPMIFYHHPKDGHHAVLNWLFQQIRRERVPIKTMGEYARWWKMRIASIPKLRYTKGSVHLHGVKLDRSLYIHIVQPDGTEAIIPTSKQIVLETVRWKQKPAAWVMPEDYLRERRFNYRIPLVRSRDAMTNLFRRKKK
jgi:hypothetical protein